MKEIELLTEENRALREQLRMLENTLDTVKKLKRSEQLEEYIQSRKAMLKFVQLMNDLTTHERLCAIDLEKKIKSLEYEKEAVARAIKDDMTRQKAEWQNKLRDSGLSNWFDMIKWGKGYRITKYKGPRYGALIIPETIEEKEIKEIGRGVFENCLFEYVYLPNTLTGIRDGAFKNCKQLKSIVLPIKSALFDNVFEGCSALNELQFQGDGAIVAGRKSFMGTSIESVTLPKGTRVITEEMFFGCKHLKTAFLNDGILRIFSRAFSHTSIEQLVIPETVEQIEISAFSNLLSEELELAVLGENTILIRECENNSIDRKFRKLKGRKLLDSGDYGSITIYCLPHSAIEEQAHELKIPTRPIREFVYR